MGCVELKPLGKRNPEFISLGQYNFNLSNVVHEITFSNCDTITIRLNNVCRIINFIFRTWSNWSSRYERRCWITWTGWNTRSTRCAWFRRRRWKTRPAWPTRISWNTRTGRISRTTWCAWKRWSPRLTRSSWYVLSVIQTSANHKQNLGYLPS